MIVPIILAGGSGSRLWPLSRSAYPKQLLSLVSSQTMLQDTVLRVRSVGKITPPVIICNQEHRFLVAEQLQVIGERDTTIILEPVGKNTAPAVAIAALLQRENDPILLILPADHVIKDTAYFIRMINAAVPFAVAGKLVTFGVSPTQPETGYGYIKIANLLEDHAAYSVEKFVEKPDRATAEKYLASGQYYWNSGMFMFKASQYLAELECYAPAILQTCKKTIAQITKDMDFIRLNQTIFSECPNDSIDYAVMEKTKNAVLVPFTTEWSDVGSWSALYEAHEADQNGNILQGDVIIDEVKNSYLRAESRMLAAVGIKDHIVIETSDAVLVAHKNSSQEVKNIITRLKQNQRSEIDLHRKIYRPWGHYEVLHQGECFQVKRISIKPSASLSLQMHHHRSEHWVVVTGTAQVTRGEDSFVISENESTYIPKAVKHRLSNPGNKNLEIIEIQLGNYLGEDDIVRFEDNYGRA